METLEKKYSRKSVFTKTGDLLPIENRTYLTKQGYKCIVIDGGTKSSCCTIQINDWIKEVQLSNVRNGTIKYPYHPSIVNRGYLGEGTYETWDNKKRNNTKVYNLWINMLRRCYDEVNRHKNKSYKGVQVHSDWYNFQNFAKWFYEESNYRESWELDKDLLSKDTKIYSPKTCIFIPKSLNNFLATTLKNNTSGNTGVFMDKRHPNKWRARIGKTNLGTFDIKEEANTVYVTARYKEAEKWKTEMRGILPQNAIDNIK